MKKEWLVKTLALGIVVLFISVSSQPVFADDLEQFDETLDESKPDNYERMDGGFENSECFVEGETDGARFPNRIFLIIMGLLFHLDWVFNYRIRSNVDFGSTWCEANKKLVIYYPAYGWIYTNGTNGEKNYSGYFYGNIEGNAPAAQGYYWMTYHLGMIDFTGTVIHNASWIYYKGYASRVVIIPGEPTYPLNYLKCLISKNSLFV